MDKYKMENLIMGREEENIFWENYFRLLHNKNLSHFCLEWTNNTIDERDENGGSVVSCA